MKDKRYQSSMYCIFMKIRMVNLTLFVLIRHYIIRMKRWNLCQLSKEIVSGAEAMNASKQFEENSPFSISFQDQYLSLPFLIKEKKCYIPLQTRTEVEVKYLPILNLTSQDGTWYPSSSNFDVINPDPFSLNLSQYYDAQPNRNLCSIQSDPVVEDEFLSSINTAFD